jgi:xyloglucan-specific endo-beta-1,4-glucanase
MSNTNIVADVAYDLFTSYTPHGSNVNEIMVWVANYNSGPIAEAYDASGNAIKTASNINIDGLQWDLFKGWNGQNNVYSFLPSGGKIITSFDGDLYLFFKVR